MASIAEAVSALPLKGVRAVFAYGSGVFRQGQHVDVRKNMLDLVVVVEGSDEWHRRNLKMHPEHYSFLKHLGAYNVNNIQRRGAGVYYNTLLELAGRSAKYGVVEMKDLCHDLETWDHLYLSGRLHKPVRFVLHPDKTCERLREALQRNLHHAVAAAMLQMPQEFTARDLYLTIAGLSYHGDFRLAVGGEDRNKIENLVDNNMEEFHTLYRPILQDWFGQGEGMDFENFTQDVHRHQRFRILKSLPSGLMKAIRDEKGTSLDPGLLIADLSDNRLRCATYVQNACTRLVDRSSRSQTVKSMFTAGVGKSIQYAWRKVKKYHASKS